MIEVIKYNTSHKQAWDEFVDKAKNGTFLFKRDFMEYHSDRFVDYSLLIYDKSKLTAIFPANESDDTVFSHQGLTFGGLVSLYKSTTSDSISYFNALNMFLSDHGIKYVVYKAIPHIYTTRFGEEDRYILYRLNAEIVSCNISSAIDLSAPAPTSRNRKRNWDKAINNHVNIEQSDDYSVFWEVMTANMKTKYNAKPVHTCNEITLLKTLFPNNITLLLAKIKDKIVAGGVLFIFKDVIKVQYAHASEYGKKIGAIDALYFNIIDKFRGQFKYVDFGSSNLESGKILQTPLINQKEGFGARGAEVITYKYLTSSNIYL